MTSRDDFSSYRYQPGFYRAFSNDVHPTRADRLTARILKGLLVVGVAWVALTIAFTIVGLMTSTEGATGQSEVSKGSPTSMVPISEEAATQTLVLVVQEGRPA